MGRWLVVVAALLVPAAPAAADETIYAGPPNQYLTDQVTIDQGERVTFANFDVADHDVTARDRGPDGRPLFGSELVSLGGSAPVAGTEYLTTGSYAFYCSIHPQMTGTIEVTAAGTPVPRPDPGGQPPPGAPPPSEARSPGVAVQVLDGRLREVSRRRALRVRVNIDEPVLIGIVATTRGRRIASALTRLDAAGAHEVRLMLNWAGRRTVARARNLRIALTARADDAAGNRAEARAAHTLSR